ncbi:hypothetical protein F5Y11DRAFT_366261 [Daldinia sp. FL1419]|nr:hypothetical protein F5Y11DRAFT_366261 [Daldinia sp. FL1419]
MAGNHTQDDGIRQVHTLFGWCCRINHDPQWFEDGAAIEEHIEQEHPKRGKGPQHVYKFHCEKRKRRLEHVYPIYNPIPDDTAVEIQSHSHELRTASIERVTTLIKWRFALLQHIAGHLNVLPRGGMQTYVQILIQTLTRTSEVCQIGATKAPISE